MEWFAGKLAFVTGGGSGIGRCSVSTCDWNADAVADAAATAQAGAPDGVLVSGEAAGLRQPVAKLISRGAAGTLLRRALPRSVLRAARFA